MNEKDLAIQAEAERVDMIAKFNARFPEQQGTIIEKIVEKEIIKEVPVEVIKEVIKADPILKSELIELKELLEFKDDEIKTLKDSLADSLNAEQAAIKAKIDLEVLNIKLEKEEKKAQLEAEIAALDES